MQFSAKLSASCGVKKTQAGSARLHVSKARTSVGHQPLYCPQRGKVNWMNCSIDSLKKWDLQICTFVECCNLYKNWKRNCQCVHFKILVPKKGYQFSTMCEKWTNYLCVMIMRTQFWLMFLLILYGKLFVNSKFYNKNFFSYFSSMR